MCSSDLFGLSIPKASLHVCRAVRVHMCVCKVRVCVCFIKGVLYVFLFICWYVSACVNICMCVCICESVSASVYEC